MNKIHDVSPISQLEGVSSNQVLPSLSKQQRVVLPTEDNNDDSEQNESDQVKFLDLFRFATKFDIILLLFGIICAGIMGASQPMIIIFIGDITNIFIQLVNLEEKAFDIFIKIAYVGVVAFMTGWGMYASWMIAGERQHIKCRKQYLKSLLKQEIGWFDINNQSQISTKFAVDCFAFKGAISQNVSTLFMTISLFISGFAVAFKYGWLMTCVVLGSLPFIVIGGVTFTKTISYKEHAQQKKYTEAGGRVEESVSSIKTIKNLNGQAHEAKKYSMILDKVTNTSTKFGLLIGFGLGLLMFIILCSFSLGFWYGSLCAQGTEACPAEKNGGNTYKPGDVIVIFFSVLLGGFSLSQLTPVLKKISKGRVAAKRIFDIIDREPRIKSLPLAIVPQQFKGKFQFHDITFAYPKAKSSNILQYLSLVIDCKSSAFSGSSGCGKSTIFQLMMRFYDPDSGSVTLDGIDLKQLDLTWLRSQIGYVGQEPALFATTIKQNLLFGKQNANEDQIIEALKQAQIKEFVEKLQHGLETYVGGGGGRLSGGQKQRVAIARALLKNPKMLLLDQATSALDRKNERLIQKTLNKRSKQRITITIAHKIKTIVNADKIFVLLNGKVKEEGRFKDLEMSKNYSIDYTEIYLDVESQLEPEQQTILNNNGNSAAQRIEKLKALKQKALDGVLEEYERQGIYGRLFSYLKDFKLLFFVGILIAIANGLLFPFFSIILVKIIVAMFKLLFFTEQGRNDANRYSLIVFFFGVGSFFLNLFQQAIFIKIGDQLTRKLRQATYEKALKMPIVWFDQPEHSSGAISMKLASECQMVKDLISNMYPNLIQVITTLVGGIAVSFYYEWRTSLVSLAVLPVILLAGMLQMKIAEGFGDKTDKIYEDASSLIAQSMNSIRTVTAFCSQNIIEKKHSVFLEKPLEEGVKKGIVSGLFYGLTQGVVFVLVGFVIYIGVVFLVRNNLSYEDLFTTLYAFVISGITAGNNSHHLPDVSASKKAAASIFQMLDAEDEEDLQAKSNSKGLKTPIDGDIQFRNVYFKYQSQEKQVLNGVSFKISKGQKVGIVGQSGCGKSTIFQLIQRFYDADKGQILIDGIDIKQYDIYHLRSAFGVVSQEPNLFNDTIRGNIQYNKTDASEENIRTAAIQSNFDPENDFLRRSFTLDKKKSQLMLKKSKENTMNTIPSQFELENPSFITKSSVSSGGFNKNVGVKGSHLSGGQKQRVAIARVALRKPQILLLDEATSALDNYNERKVQQTLDQMMRGKTTLSISHRMDIIRNSDQILVFDGGQIVEHGTYNQLIAQKGFFYRHQKGQVQKQKSNPIKQYPNKSKTTKKDKVLDAHWQQLLD